LKFLCDNCKAKYQIADDKVAGKTVRMKCRKCGHQIEVRAAITETSVSGQAPKAPEAPRPRGLATSLSATKPKAPSQPQSALAGAFKSTIESPPSTQPMGTAAGSIEVNVNDEWYVAINGVPVGPVRISELRRKAAAGAVTEDSLCWQEGLEEWRPVRAIPELAALVREAAQANRVSLVTPPPEVARPSRPPMAPAPQRPSPSMAPSPPRAPAAAAPEPQRPPAPMRSNVVPLHAARATPLGKPEEPIASPFGALAVAQSPSLAPMPTPQPPPPAPIAISDPFAAPPPAAMASPAMPFSTSPSSPSFASPSLAPPAPSLFAQPPQQQKKGVPLWFWPIPALFVGFGVAGGVFLFRQQPPQQIVVQVPAQPTSPTQSARTDDTPPPAAADSAQPAAPETKTAGKVATNGSKTAPTAEKKGLDLSGLNAGPGGPNVGPGGGAAGASGGGLDSAGVERVVAAHRAGVKRTCWERGATDQKSSVNINVSATVNPDGSVGSSSASGDDPVVGKCIADQVRTWRFPAPGSPQPIVIPFKFVRQ
jgi:predicted Zn finger-like uncharacterized protein